MLLMYVGLQGWILKKIHFMESLIRKRGCIAVQEYVDNY